tara:strand:- start:915 stop:1616 length:702 start_codon:yes stop_codon:yes gene_type:complete
MNQPSPHLPLTPMTDEQREKEAYYNPYHGCKVQRSDIINFLIKKHNYKNYLEIGVANGINLQSIEISHVDGVDPGAEGIIAPETNYPMTSDAFFESIEGRPFKYDIIFVDGLHYDYQVYNDVLNSLKHLASNGTIVCHDMNPQWSIVQNKSRTPGIPEWNGDCWKAWAALRTELKDHNMQVVNTDQGVGVISSGAQQCITLPCEAFDLDYSYLAANRETLLNLVSVDDFFNQE